MLLISVHFVFSDEVVYLRYFNTRDVDFDQKIVIGTSLPPQAMWQGKLRNTRLSPV